jgi:carbon monoxide dehydrogenase subunit G
MASVRKEAVINAAAQEVWDALRDIGNVVDLFPGTLTDSRLDDERARTVTFSNGLVVSELIVDMDDDARRLAYTVQGGGFTHHNASMQIIQETERSCRFIWISDFLPDEALEAAKPLIDSGTRSFEHYWNN